MQNSWVQFATFFLLGLTQLSLSLGTLCCTGFGPLEVVNILLYGCCNLWGTHRTEEEEEGEDEEALAR